MIRDAVLLQFSSFPRVMLRLHRKDAKDASSQCAKTAWSLSVGRSKPNKSSLLYNPTVFLEFGWKSVPPPHRPSYTVWLEILAGNLFWQIGGIESNLSIFLPPKFVTIIA